jgi:hypothetical protein
MQSHHEKKQKIDLIESQEINVVLAQYKNKHGSYILDA